MHNKTSYTDEKLNKTKKPHKHRKQTTENHGWAGKKQVLWDLTKKPRGNLKRGEFLISIFNPVKNYFVFPFFGNKL